jgi:Sigma-70, region 4
VLRLIFTACHPSLSRDARVALTLKLVGGLSTEQIARAFLVSTPTMAARITRAKKALADAKVLPAADARRALRRPARRVRRTSRRGIFHDGRLPRPRGTCRCRRSGTGMPGGGDRDQRQSPETTMRSRRQSR